MKSKKKKNDIGYVILESAADESTTTQIISDNKNGHVVAEAILQTANERNRNGRYYSAEELFPQVTCPRTLELLEAGYFRGEMGHPLSKDLVRQQTIDDTLTCVKYNKIWIDGLNIMGLYQGTNNEHGKAIEQDLLEGCKPAFSLRALGTVENTHRGAEVKSLHWVTYDCVIYPSHPGAYTQRVVSEGAHLGDLDETTVNESGYLIPITNESVINYIRSESANLKYMAESFDFMYDNIDVNPKHSTVTLTDKNGSIFVVNLEDYVAKEIRDYCFDYIDD